MQQEEQEYKKRQPAVKRAAPRECLENNKSHSHSSTLLQTEHGVSPAMFLCSIAHDFSKINGGLLQTMKEKLSVHELCAYLTAHKPSMISYWTENQEWHSTEDPCKLKLDFTAISIRENPNRVLFESKDSGQMLLNMVRYIEIDEHSEVFPVIMTVFCGSKTANKSLKPYIFILS